LEIFLNIVKFFEKSIFSVTIGLFSVIKDDLAVSCAHGRNSSLGLPQNLVLFPFNHGATAAQGFHGEAL
jgi:hypothetical protein